ncbi:MAG: NAD(P)/FAD-dependent oxidoreductase [Alphaproteobacteria bacterium]|nr:NAD(P)/FAD-dependent oxidoreductase [Alphaproteobacteria bacterium]MCW5744544.1 NAD(P)/FAD-dependent oxidoreductase [Alphaproteobacteria bacterium]
MSGLAALEAHIKRDHALTCFPEPRWVPPRRTADGQPILDVLIVGAGQGGQAVATQLLRERVDNILVIDRAPVGGEGPWRSFARMRTLRTWKTVTGPDLGMPSLTFQAWFEAQHGAAAFEALGKIAKETWHDYLLWLRRVLALPVRNGVELRQVRPGDGYLIAGVCENARERLIFARKVVLAMGIEKSGSWTMPPQIAGLPVHLRAHTADAIDFAALSGRRVAVLGAGASAFDNAATALEAGAAEVRLYCRRPELQRVQPYKAISSAGFLRHFGTLDDATRWRFMRHLLSIREALPVETWNRVTQHANFHLHTGSPWVDARAIDGAIEITTPRGKYGADFAISGTGFDMDITARREIAEAIPHVATWADRYTPQSGEQDARLGRYPYLGAGFELVERVQGAAPWLKDIHVFDFGTMMSFGPSGASINGMKFAVPRLAFAITRDLFTADIEHHYATMMAYDTPEFPHSFARASQEPAA